MNTSAEATVHICIVANTQEEANAVHTKMKEAAAKSESSSSAHVETTTHVVGSESKRSQTKSDSNAKFVLVLTAESQSDWEKVKAEYETKLKAEGESKTVVASNSDEQAKTWGTEVHASATVNVNGGVEAFNSLKTSIRSALSLSTKVNVTANVTGGLGF